jgi:hypothetical protein
MHILLEVAPSLGGAHCGQILHRGLQQFRNVQLDLLAQAGILQRLQQIWFFNVGESATQRTLHNIVVHHCHASRSESLAGARPLGSALPLF